MSYNNPMKIAIDARFWGPRQTGLGRYTENLVRALAKLKSDHQFTLFVEQDTLAEITALPANFQLAKLTVKHHTAREQLSVSMAINQGHYDLVHFPHYIVPLLNLRTPFVITMHDLIKLKYPGSAATTLPPLMYHLKNVFYRLDNWWAVNHSQHIITDTQVVKNDLISFFSIPPEKITPIPLGIDDSIKLSTAREVVLAKYALHAKKYLLFVGNAYPYKNVETLILAVKNCPADLELVLVGARDSFQERLSVLAKETGVSHKVKQLGFVSDGELAVLYSAAYAYVSLSLEEGFGLQPLEAMLHGCPVILSDIPVYREVCGEAALYAPPQNARAFLVQVQILADPAVRKKLITKGAEQVKQYRWSKTAAATLAVYNDILQCV